MYSLYQGAATKCLLKNFEIFCGQDNASIEYTNNIPYIASNNIVVHIEFNPIEIILKLVSKVLQVYGMFYDPTAQTFIDKNQMPMHIDFMPGTIFGWWPMYEVGDVGMYAINDNTIERLMVLFLVDPLALIDKMRLGIDKSQAKNFFGSLEYYVSKTIHIQLIKYYMWIMIAQKENIVGDIVRVVINKWLQLDNLLND